MLSHEYYAIKSYHKLYDTLNAYHKVFMDYITLFKSNILTSEHANVQTVLFHHLELIFKSMESVYKILYEAIAKQYDEISKIEIQDLAIASDVLNKQDFSYTLGYLEQDNRLKSLAQMKQFIDACKAELKLISGMKRSKFVVVEQKVV